jgi:ABC-type dipeptide/oligopeptide/nickel transport system ATPase component
MKDKKITLAIGKSGSGKSYLVHKLIQGKRRLIIFDTMAEYTEGVVFDDKRKFLEYWKHCARKSFRLIYQPLDDPEEEIDDIAELVYHLGNVTFVIEEVTAYTRPNQISRQLAHCIQRGRHKNIELIGTTQRPYGLHRLLTSQCRDIYVFNTNEPRDRDYLRTLLGQDMEAKLESLDKYNYVKWTDGNETLEIGKA